MELITHKNLVIITGATKGIGKEIAGIFAGNGFPLSICSRHIKDLQETAVWLKKKGSPSVHYKKTDLSKRKEVLAYGKEILNRKLKISALINNGGVYLKDTQENKQGEILEFLLRTNLFSAYYLTHYILPEFKKQKTGHIINICSVAGLKPFPDGIAYGISKFAMRGMGLSLREELKKHKVKITTIYPGATYTDSWKGTKLPVSRFMPAEEVAQVVWNCFNTSPRTVIEEVVMRPMAGDL